MNILVWSIGLTLFLIFISFLNTFWSWLKKSIANCDCQKPKDEEDDESSIEYNESSIELDDEQEKDHTLLIGSFPGSLRRMDPRRVMYFTVKGLKYWIMFTPDKREFPYLAADLSDESLIGLRDFLLARFPLDINIPLMRETVSESIKLIIKRTDLLTGIINDEVICSDESKLLMQDSIRFIKKELGYIKNKVYVGYEA